MLDGFFWIYPTKHWEIFLVFSFLDVKLDAEFSGGSPQHLSSAPLPLIFWKYIKEWSDRLAYSPKRFCVQFYPYMWKNFEKIRKNTDSGGSPQIWTPGRHLRIYGQDTDRKWRRAVIECWRSKRAVAARKRWKFERSDMGSQEAVKDWEINFETRRRWRIDRSDGRNQETKEDRKEHRWKPGGRKNSCRYRENFSVWAKRLAQKADEEQQAR